MFMSGCFEKIMTIAQSLELLGRWADALCVQDGKGEIKVLDYVSWNTGMYLLRKGGLWRWVFV